MNMRIQAVSRRLTTATGSTGSQSEDAYRSAVKDLKDAQKKLTTDLAAKAADNVLLADRLAIQVAQAQLAQAASALAVNDESSEQTTPTATAAPVAARLTPPSAVVDVYA